MYGRTVTLTDGHDLTISIFVYCSPGDSPEYLKEQAIQIVKNILNANLPLTMVV